MDAGISHEQAHIDAGRLEHAISVNMVEHAPHEKNLGWEFVYDENNTDPVLNIQFLSEAYYKADDDYTGRTTVPALIDVQTGKVVNNDYNRLTLINMARETARSLSSFSL